MKTKKGWSIAPKFPKGVVSENLVLSNRCVSENQDSEGRFDSTKFYEGCRFRHFGAVEPQCFQKKDFDSVSEVSFQKFGAIEPLRFRKSGQRRAVR